MRATTDWDWLTQVYALGPHFADNPREHLKTIFFLALPDTVKHILWLLHGDFKIQCEHVQRRQRPAYEVLVLEHWKKKGDRWKLVWRAKVFLCRECALIV